MSTTPDTARTDGAHPTLAVDRGLTDTLDGLLGDRLRGARRAIDARAGIRVDARGVHIRRLLRTKTLSWSTMERVVLDNRLDLGLSFATRFVPVGRVPVLGDRVQALVGAAAEAVTKRVAPGVRADAGWIVATFERKGRLRDDVDLDTAATLTALLHPDITAAIELHAEEHGIPVERS